jgi:hypothetical protein
VLHQYSALAACPLVVGLGAQHRKGFSWDFEARPTPLSRQYKLRLKYQEGKAPEVFVIEPDLVELANGKRLLHVYSQKPTKLCLYLPKTGEWNSSMLISKTTVPWAILWLYYFEDWLRTGKWNGGGVHIESEKDSSDT